MQHAVMTLMGLGRYTVRCLEGACDAQALPGVWHCWLHATRSGARQSDLDWVADVATMLRAEYEHALRN